MKRVHGQLDEVIRYQPYQFTKFKDSIRRGSRTGKREVRGTIRRYTKPSVAPMAISESKSQMLTCTPVPCNAGKTTRYMSSICMQTIHPATMQSWCGCCLIERNSKIGKAMKKRPITNSMLSAHQDSVFLVIKNCVSSGMFAYQMSMYWPKPM